MDENSMPAPVPGIRVYLADGTPVLLRLFTPADRAAVQEAFRRLSVDSHYYRFWSGHQEIPDSLLNRFLNPEPGLHETWAVQNPATPDEPGYGGGSFWRQEQEPERAEISFTVADELQHHGVGTLLLALLWLRARMAGITEFFGMVLPDNYAMLDWVRALGAKVSLDRGQYVFTLRLEETNLKSSPTSQHLKFRLAQLAELLQL